MQSRDLIRRINVLEKPHEPKRYTQTASVFSELRHLNRVRYLTPATAMASLQLAQSKAGWINWSGSCASEEPSPPLPISAAGPDHLRTFVMMN